MTQKNPLVEVIILTHNNKKILNDCLNSLKKTQYKNLKVTIVDQDSSDGTSELIKKNYPKFNVFRNKINESFSAANNKILKSSKAKYCILLNDDTTQEPNWINELVKVAEADEKIAVLQPKILSMKNKKMFEHAGAGGGFIDIFGYEFCRGRIFSEIEEDKGQYDNIKEVFWVCGVALFIRRKVLDEVGYLDEDFGSYFEETDLSWRINSAKYLQKYIPRSIVYHIGSATWGNKKNSATKEYLLHRNSWFVLGKNYSRKNWFWILPSKLLLEMITIFAFLFTNPKKSYASLKGFIWFIFNIGKINKGNKKTEDLKKISDIELMQKMVKTSVALQYFISGKKYFKEYEKFL
ncbi:MAG: glycosyltransferase family 2 protein [Nanoarchaeota archaeon]